MFYSFTGFVRALFACLLIFVGVLLYVLVVFWVCCLAAFWIDIRVIMRCIVLCVYELLLWYGCDVIVCVVDGCVGFVGLWTL